MNRLAVILSDGHGEDTKGKWSPIFHSRHIIGDRVFEKGERFKENDFNSPVIDGMEAGLEKCLIPTRQIAPQKKDMALPLRATRQHELYDELQALGFSPITISVHCNGLGDGSTWNTAQGLETYFKAGCPDSIKLARLVQQKIMRFRQNYEPYNHLTDRGLKTANFYIFREYKGPVVLPESEFMTNVRTLRLLCSEKYREDTIQAYIEAILQFQGFSLLGDMREKTEKTV